MALGTAVGQAKERLGFSAPFFFERKARKIGPATHLLVDGRLCSRDFGGAKRFDPEAIVA